MGFAEKRARRLARERALLVAEHRARISLGDQGATSAALLHRARTGQKVSRQTVAGFRAHGVGQLVDVLAETVRAEEGDFPDLPELKAEVLAELSAKGRAELPRGAHEAQRLWDAEYQVYLQNQKSGAEQEYVPHTDMPDHREVPTASFSVAAVRSDLANGHQDAYVKAAFEHVATMQGAWTSAVAGALLRTWDPAKRAELVKTYEDVAGQIVDAAAAVGSMVEASVAYQDQDLVPASLKKAVRGALRTYVSRKAAQRTFDGIPIPELSGAAEAARRRFAGSMRSFVIEFASTLAGSVEWRVLQDRLGPAFPGRDGLEGLDAVVAFAPELAQGLDRGPGNVEALVQHKFNEAARHALVAAAPGTARIGEIPGVETVDGVVSSGDPVPFHAPAPPNPGRDVEVRNAVEDVARTQAQRFRGRMRMGLLKTRGKELGEIATYFTAAREGRSGVRTSDPGELVNALILGVVVCDPSGLAELTKGVQGVGPAPESPFASRDRGLVLNAAMGASLRLLAWESGVAAELPSAVALPGGDRQRAARSLAANIQAYTAGLGRAALPTTVSVSGVQAVDPRSPVPAQGHGLTAERSR